MAYRIIEHGERRDSAWEFATAEDRDQAFRSLISGMPEGHILISYDEHGEAVDRWPPIASETSFDGTVRANGSVRGLKCHIPSDVARKMDLQIGDQVHVIIRKL